MDASRFDDLSRAFAQGRLGRRRLLGGLAAAAGLAPLVVRVGSARADTPIRCDTEIAYDCMLREHELYLVDAEAAAVLCGVGLGSMLGANNPQGAAVTLIKEMANCLVRG